MTDRLDDSQLTAFDTEYVHDRLWARVEARIAADFPAGDLSVLDLGGGTGRFVDRVLGRWPGASGVVLDNAASLLARNRPDPRKRLVEAGVEDLATALGTQRFDLVVCNWLLHHLVVTGDRRASLVALPNLLTPCGRISIPENLYDGWIDGASTWLIFRATSLRGLARLARAGGANTAGVGVRFRSTRGWRAAFARSGLVVRGEDPDRDWDTPRGWRPAFLLRRVRAGHLWLEPRTHA